MIPKKTLVTLDQSHRSHLDDLCDPIDNTSRQATCRVSPLKAWSWVKLASFLVCCACTPSNPPTCFFPKPKYITYGHYLGYSTSIGAICGKSKFWIHGYCGFYIRDLRLLDLGGINLLWIYGFQGTLVGHSKGPNGDGCQGNTRIQW
jgi:hypothetical protein